MKWPSWLRLSGSDNGTTAPAVKDQPKREPEEISAEGVVVRRAEVLDGGYKTGSSTEIHLSVEIAGDGAAEPRVISFKAGCGFTMLPMVKAGDRVKVVYKVKESGHIELLRFGIVWGEEEFAYAAALGAVDENADEVKGVVVRRVESLAGGYKTGSSTNIHLAVLVWKKDHSGSEVVTFKAGCGFVYLPLAQVGDVVRFKAATKEGGHLDLQSFITTIEPAERSAGE